jgi:hypothetical protein
MIECCGTCRFWDQDEEDEEHGYCHRYPPQMVRGREGIVSCWPETDCEEFCGEWQPEEDQGPPAPPTPN